MKNKQKMTRVIVACMVTGLMIWTIGTVYERVYASFVTMPAAAVLVPTAAGVNVAANERAEIDYSNASDGYVKVRFLQQTSASVRVIVRCPRGTQYQYRLNTGGRWEVFPLSEGNGRYTIGVFEQVEGSRFAQAITVDVDVRLVDEFAPFLRPNQFVNFNANSAAVSLANDLVRGSTSVIDSVSLVYNWVIENIEYDFALAASVQSGYVPDLEQLMVHRRGICFDYASLTTAMLRSQGIPTRLVIGYVGDVFHAWISVYSPEHGWINNIIEFSGGNWQIMDPTFAATGNQGEEVMRLIGNGQNHNPTHFH